MKEAICAIGGLLLAAGAANADITTNAYDAGSTSDDIALSCKQISVGSTSGILGAKCNKEDSDGDVAPAATNINLKQHVACVATADGGYEFAWPTSDSSASADASPSYFAVFVSSDGQDYELGGHCRTTSGNTSDAGVLDLGDITNGLENDDGSLERRSTTT